MAYTMDPTEREAFLKERHVAILSIAEPERGPLAVPIWYAYEGGDELSFVTGLHSRKGKRLRKDGRVSLCAQSEQAPYKYVSVEGPVVEIQPADVEHHVRPLAHRYLGPSAGDRYVDNLSNIGEDILVRVRIERWLSVDYGKEEDIGMS